MSSAFRQRFHLCSKPGFEGRGLQRWILGEKPRVALWSTPSASSQTHCKVWLSPPRNISGDSIKSYLQVKSTRAGFLEGLQPLGRVHIATGYKCKREGVAEGNHHAPTADLLLLGRGQEPRRRGEKEWGRRASCTHEAAVVCCY